MNEDPANAATLLAPRVAAVGTAVPPDSYTQRELLDEFRITEPRIRSLFLNSAIERRSLCLPPRSATGERTVETQGALLRKHVRVGLQMGCAAVAECLQRAGATAADVRYLCCVSSTGF